MSLRRKSLFDIRLVIVTKRSHRNCVPPISILVSPPMNWEEREDREEEKEKKRKEKKRKEKKRKVRKRKEKKRKEKKRKEKKRKEKKKMRQGWKEKRSHE